MGLFSFLFSKDKQLEDLKSKGAVILDVRSSAEYRSGAIADSKHIPLPEVNSRLDEIKQWNAPIICCCASGIRSAKAAAILRKHGLQAINGGGWASLNKKL